MTGFVLAIDPGNTQSGFAFISTVNRQPIDCGKVDNASLRGRIEQGEFNAAESVAIEMVASYGMAVGREVFETCVWIGRYQQTCLDWIGQADLVFRREVKLHHCYSAKAKDSNIAQALIDRFASGQRNRGKGTKAEPGWFYGFRSDIWQAYALAVLAADRLDRSWVTA